MLSGLYCDLLPLLDLYLAEGIFVLVREIACTSERNKDMLVTA